MAERILRLSLVLSGLSVLLHAQTATTAPLKFDVASVKPNNSGGITNANFPLGPGDVYSSNGGHFIATNFPLISYIYFAFRITGEQAQTLPSQLPGWVSTERFDIEARTDGDPAKDTKNQMRLMVRALLAERFGLTSHYETKQVPVFGLLPVKPGRTGPQLQAHPDTARCSTAVPTAADPPDTTVPGGFPVLCGGFLGMPPSTTGRARVGARNITMAFIANGLADFGNLGRPVVDQTGLTGTFDMALEWVPERDGSGTFSESQPDPSGPNFLQAVREQLGLKLDSQKGEAQFLVIDHIERPTGN